MEMVDFAGPYLYATIVCLAKSGTPQAAAVGIHELTGTCTSQIGTIWYDTCLPQISGATIQAPAASAPDMINALITGTVDFVYTDLPTAEGAVAKNPELVVLNFAGTDGDFQFATEQERAENVNIGVSVGKGNAELQKLLNDFLATMNEDDFSSIMVEAIKIQPAI
jgi:putative lysine transport system substrate-binding protein